MKIWTALLPCFVACYGLAAGSDYATYIGDFFPYQTSAIATDASGNTYVAGSRALSTSAKGLVSSTDVFLTKLDSSGNIVFTATLSGKGSDRANGVAVDAAGNIFVVGDTNSSDFPLLNPLQEVIGDYIDPVQTGFLAKFSPSGSLLFSTFLGGQRGQSSLNAVAVDASGNAYVAGWGNAPDSPRTPGLPPGGGTGGGPGGITSALFAKISAAGDKILYGGGFTASQHACAPVGSSCFLSEINTSGVAIAVDAAGNAYLAGTTAGFGIAGTPGSLLAAGMGPFVAKIDASGSAVDYLTYLTAPINEPGIGAEATSTLYAINVDAFGNAYLAGGTSNPSFPATPGSYQSSFTCMPNPVGACTNGVAFLAKLNPKGSAMVWATYLGGTSTVAQALATDAAGDVWVAGGTSSPTFPNANGFPQGNQFLVEFNPSGSALNYSALFPPETVGPTIAIDSSGVVHSASETGLVSTFTPRQVSAPRILGLGNSAGGSLAGRVSPGEVISMYGLNLGPTTAVSSTFSPAGFLPTTLAGVQVSIGGTALPLLYVSNTQINAVTPLGLAPLSTDQLQVTYNGASLSPMRVVVDFAEPQVFRDSTGATVAVNQDGTLNSSANPAHPGSVVAIWATGLPPLYGVVDGQEQTAGQQGCSCALIDPYTGNTLPIVYDGAAPGTIAGLYQINFQIPSGYSGNAELVLSSGQKYSDRFAVSIK